MEDPSFGQLSYIATYHTVLCGGGQGSPTAVNIHSTIYLDHGCVRQLDRDALGDGVMDGRMTLLETNVMDEGSRSPHLDCCKWRRNMNINAEKEKYGMGR